MKRKFFHFLLAIGMVLFASCPGTSSDDGRIIDSGTKISDFSGHKNSLDWLLGRFKDESDMDLFVIEDTAMTIGASPFSMEYAITKITYNPEETLVEKLTAPSGSWTFELSHDEDAIVYVIQKNDKDSFYLGNPSFEEMGALRKRII